MSTELSYRNANGGRDMAKGSSPGRSGGHEAAPSPPYSPQMSVHELKAMFERYDFGMLPVVDDQGVLRGVVGILDLFKMVRPAGSWWSLDLRALWGRRV